MSEDLLDVFSQTFLFEQPLPQPTRIDTLTGGVYQVEMAATDQFLGLYVDLSGTVEPEQIQTTVWGYGLSGSGVTYPGPTFVAYEGERVRIKWINNLPLTGYYYNPGGTNHSHKYFHPVDLSLHRAHPMDFPVEEGYVPTVPHLHGGKTRAQYDGHAEAWFVQDYQEKGGYYQGNLYVYDNDQHSATLWYHDHALGFTRLNVYAGLAGFYLLRDETEQALIESGVLPSGIHEIELAIQDRAFTAEGALFLPSNSAEQEALYGGVMFENTDMYFNSETGEYRELHQFTAKELEDEVPDPEQWQPVPSTMPEFFGNVILINGMTWPYLEVESTQYRLRMLNGSDSRFFVLGLQDVDLDDGVGDIPEIYRIGTDLGLLAQAQQIAFSHVGGGYWVSDYVLENGGRHDLVFDFSGLDGKSVNLLNFGPAMEPFGGIEDFNPHDEFDGFENLYGYTTAFDLNKDDSFARTGYLMQFRVGGGNGDLESADPGEASGGVSAGTVLSPHDQPEDLLSDDVALVRKLALFEGEDEYGRIQPLLGLAEDVYDRKGNLIGEFGSLMWDDPITEKVALDSTEVWAIYNTTADAHPIHLHLTPFQVLGYDIFSFEEGSDEITDWWDDPDDFSDSDWTPEMPAAARYQDGWQDTAWVGPGEVIYLKASFELPGEYMWHCHILSHEDHEMMRPFEVVRNPKDVVASMEYWDMLA